MHNLKISLIDKKLNNILKKWGICLRNFPILHTNLYVTEDNYKNLFTDDVMIFRMEKWVQALAMKSDQDALNAFALRQYYYYVDNHHHGEKQQYLQKISDSDGIALRTFKDRYKTAKIWLSGCLTVYELMQTNDSIYLKHEKNFVSSIKFFSDEPLKVKHL